MNPESRLSRIRRWAKLPATVLFALSVVWLVRSFFNFLDGGSDFQASTHTGIGIARIVLDMIVIPIGGAVIGIYLLLRKRWAAIPAALLPLWSLLLASADKLGRVQAKFHQYNTNADMSSAGAGVMDLLVVLAFWLLYGLMLVHLWKFWALNSQRPQRWGMALASDESATLSANKVISDKEGSEVCLLLPEVDDMESA